MTVGVTEEHEALASSVRGWAERANLRAIARVALEGPEVRPSWWQGLADQGLLGLHVSEELGGAGAGGVELAVAVEELGRALAHGPVLPTLCASLVLSQVGGTAAKELLPSLADGSRTAAVAVEAGLVATVSDDGVVVSGTATRVLGAALADVLVLGAGDTWFVVDADQVVITPLTGMDGTRRPAQVTLEAVVVPSARILSGLTLQRVRAHVGAVVAAEACGLAGWCLDTATAYAKTREQFGRVIGSFQAVKHMCADMLVRAEQARAVAWDAARALDEAPSAERDQAVAVAVAVAVEAAVDNAKACIQVLGGIGFTWEHEAHRLYKRALAIESFGASGTRLRAEVAAALLEGPATGAPAADLITSTLERGG